MVGIFIFQIGTKKKYDIYKLSPSYRRSTWYGRREVLPIWGLALRS